MIVLDTHIWVWWMAGDPQLSAAHQQIILDRSPDGLGISAISCWEVAQLAVRGRITLTMPPLDWIEDALTHPAVVPLPVTPQIAVESVQLPDLAHRDPADRFLIATARVHDCPIVTVDRRILEYPHVRTL